MSEKPKLSDNEVYDRIHDALLALGKQEGETVVGYTSMETARQALAALQIGLLMAIESGSDDNGAILTPSKRREP